MPEYTTSNQTIRPVSTPTCCPDAYLCLTDGRAEIECPRHSGFTVCCATPESHIPQDRNTWHRQMERYEQSLLNEHIRQHGTGTAHA